MPSFLERPTPRSWLTSKMMEGYATTFCTFRRYLRTTKKLNGAVLRSPTPLLALAIRSFGFAGECLGQHSGSDQLADLGDGRGERASSDAFSSPFSIPKYNK